MGTLCREHCVCVNWKHKQNVYTSLYEDHTAHRDIHAQYVLCFWSWQGPFIQVHHSVPLLRSILVCATFSCARGSWQTLVYMIQGLHQAAVIWNRNVDKLYWRHWKPIQCSETSTLLLSLVLAVVLEPLSLEAVEYNFMTKATANSDLMWNLLGMLELIVRWLFWTIKHANKWLVTSIQCFTRQVLYARRNPWWVKHCIGVTIGSDKSFVGVLNCLK